MTKKTRGEFVADASVHLLASLVVADAQLPMTDRSTHKELVDEAIALARKLTDELLDLGAI